MTVEISKVSEAVYTLTKKDDKTGKIADSVNVNANKALDNRAMGQIVTATVKSSGTRRDAFLSLLGLVFQSPRLDGFKGTGDHTTGKVSKEFKSAVRDAESDCIRSLVASGDVKLAKGEPETQLQVFLSELREDKNYSNVKVTANRYFALVGANVVTQSGYIVPVEVQQAQISEVVDKVAPDSSVASKLRAIEEHMSDSTIDAADAIDSLAYAKRLVTTLEGITNQYAEMATHGRVQPSEAQVNVVQAAEAVISTARRAPAGFGARMDAAHNPTAAVRDLIVAVGEAKF